MSANRRNDERGFTLLEVIITLALLVFIIMTVTQILRQSIDLREGLSQNARVTKRLNGAMERIAYDLNHAFLLDSHEPTRTEGKRRTIFKIEKSGGGDVLSFTYMGHRATNANTKEGDMSYVVYEVTSSKTTPSRKDLWRGEFPRVPENFKDKPPMRLLAENVESVQFDCWRGDDWAKDGWDSNKGDTDSLLPQMVRVTLRGWAVDPIDGTVEDESERELVQYATIVRLGYADDFNEVKDHVASFRLF